MDIALPHIFDENVIRRQKVYLPRQHFAVDADFIQRFRMRQNAAEILLRSIAPLIPDNTTKEGGLSLNEQLLVTLRFLATNSFYHVLRDSHGPSEATICITIKRVIRAIIQIHFNNIICWPQNGMHLARSFREKGGMPSVCGLVDGSHIPIKTPSNNEIQFVNRHGYHSLNVMAVC